MSDIRSLYTAVLGLRGPWDIERVETSVTIMGRRITVRSAFIILVDQVAQVWLTLGILLIVLPLCGLITLFTYQRRVGRRPIAFAGPYPPSNERQNQTIDGFLIDAAFAS